MPNLINISNKYFFSLRDKDTDSCFLIIKSENFE